MSLMLRSMIDNARKGFGCVLCAVFAMSGGIPALSASEQPPSLAQARVMNHDTVGIVFHDEDFYRRLVADMADVLAAEQGIRVVPVLGGSYLQCVYDLLYLRGIDLTITHADALEYLARNQGYYRVYDRIHAVANLYDERFALIARNGIDSIESLQGARVNLGAIGGGSDISGTILFDTLGISVEPMRLDKYEALEQVQRGDLDAVLFLIEEPVDALQSLGDDVTVLPIAPDPALLNHYTRSTLTADDFPNLLDGGQTIDTLAVPVIIASYNWPASRTWRRAKLERFVDGLVKNLDRLKSGPYQPAWDPVDLGREIPGVSQLAVVRTMAENARENEARVAAVRRAEEAAAIEAERARLRSAVQARIDALLESSPEPERLEQLLQELADTTLVETAAGQE